MGRTSLGNVIKINHHFARADLRICISGIKPHGTAGYGGGAKAILPGIAWAESIDYMHRTIAGIGQGRNSTVGALKIHTNECRKDMEEAARMARVDFAIQTVYNGRREPVAVFAGDVVDGFRAACRMANKHLRTEVARNADIAIINAYPQSAQPFNGMSWARSSLRDGGSAVLISQFDQGPESIHYLRERWQYETASFWEVHAGRARPVEHANPLIVYSKTLVGRDRYRFPPGTVFAHDWADVLERLGKRHRGDARVAVYPYAPIQHPPLPLDRPA